MSDIIPSNEQNIIIDKAKTGCNVIVDAVAGSGKSTTCYFIAKELSKKNILILTYSANLKEDGRSKVKALNLNNVTVESYNSFCYNYYIKMPDDRGIDITLTKKLNPTRIINYDIVILDELQDCTELYYWFINKILIDNRIDPQLIEFGDIHQSIYKYMKSKLSDSRFLSLSNYIFNAKREWCTNLKLSISYRVTPRIANFINKSCLRYDRIHTKDPSVESPSVDYIILDIFKDYEKICDMIIRLKKQYKYKDGDIFILCNSTKFSNAKSKRSLPPSALISNTLCRKGLKCFGIVEENDKAKKIVTHNKVHFSTFHGSKGLERKLVICIGMDDSYFRQKNNTHWDKDRCPDTLYVAYTRAKEKLILLHHHKNDVLPFINNSSLQDTCNVMKWANINIKIQEYPPSTVGIKDLIRNLTPIQLEETIGKYIQYTNIEPKIFDYKIDNEVETSSGWEQVRDILGIAITSFFELDDKNSLSIYDSIIYQRKEQIEQLFYGDIKVRINNMSQKLLDKTITTEDVLFISNIFLSIQHGFIFKVMQINKYNGIISEELKTVVINNMKKYVNNVIYYEKREEGIYNNNEIVGIIDVITKDTLWEIKFKDMLSNEDILQTALYSKLIKYKKTYNKLFNTLTGEIIEITNVDDGIIEYLLDMKYDNGFEKINNKEFIAKYSSDNMINSYCEYKVNSDSDSDADADADADFDYG